MSVEIIYFVHGTTTDNEQGISSGWNNVELSALGIKQSIELGGLVAHINFEVVYCSDLIRAEKSAELAFGEKYEIITDARLRECNYGDYNGQPSDIVEPLQEKMLTEKFPGGESYEDVRARIQFFLDEVRSKHQGKTIGIVAHKAPQLALDVIIKGKSWEQAFSEDWRKTKSWQPGWRFVW